MGFLYLTWGGLPKALAYYEQALAMDLQLGDAHAEADVLTSMAIVHGKAGELTEALECFTKALPL
jgi:tetratricopeptide (TPR) repeat protein